MYTLHSTHFMPICKSCVGFFRCCCCWRRRPLAWWLGPKMKDALLANLRSVWDRWINWLLFSMKNTHCALRVMQIMTENTINNCSVNFPQKCSWERAFPTTNRQILTPMWRVSNTVITRPIRKEERLFNGISITTSRVIFSLALSLIFPFFAFWTKNLLCLFFLKQLSKLAKVTI